MPGANGQPHARGRPERRCGVDALHTPTSSHDDAGSHKANSCHNPCGNLGGAAVRPKAKLREEGERCGTKRNQGISLEPCVLVVPLPFDADKTPEHYR